MKLCSDNFGLLNPKISEPAIFSLRDSLGLFICMIIISMSGFQRRGKPYLCFRGDRASAKIEQVLVFSYMHHDSFYDFIHLIQHKIPLHPGPRPFLSRQVALCAIFCLPATVCPSPFHSLSISLGGSRSTTVDLGFGNVKTSP